jgi:hypothetical protein
VVHSFSECAQKSCISSLAEESEGVEELKVQSLAAEGPAHDIHEQGTMKVLAHEAGLAERWNGDTADDC